MFFPKFSVFSEKLTFFSVCNGDLWLKLDELDFERMFEAQQIGMFLLNFLLPNIKYAETFDFITLQSFVRYP